MSSTSEESVPKKCPYCLAEVEESAKKCKSCGEWLKQEIGSDNIYCLWYSKLLAILNILVIIGVAIYWKQIESSDNPFILGKTIGIALCLSLVIGFWNYKHKKHQWPFIVVSIGSLLLILFNLTIILLLSKNYINLQNDEVTSFVWYNIGCLIFFALSFIATIRSKLPAKNIGFMKIFAFEIVFYSIIIVFIYIIKILPVERSNKIFIDNVLEIASRSSSISPEQIENLVKIKALEIGLPEARTKGAISVNKNENDGIGVVNIKIHYFQKIDFFGILITNPVEIKYQISKPYIK